MIARVSRTCRVPLALAVVLLAADALRAQPKQLSSLTPDELSDKGFAVPGAGGGYTVCTNPIASFKSAVGWKLRVGVANPQQILNVVNALQKYNADHWGAYPGSSGTPLPADGLPVVSYKILLPGKDYDAVVKSDPDQAGKYLTIYIAEDPQKDPRRTAANIVPAVASALYGALKDAYADPAAQAKSDAGLFTGLPVYATYGQLGEVRDGSGRIVDKGDTYPIPAGYEKAIPDDCKTADGKRVDDNLYRRKNGNACPPWKEAELGQLRDGVERSVYTKDPARALAYARSLKNEKPLLSTDAQRDAFLNQPWTHVSPSPNGIQADYDGPPFTAARTGGNPPEGAFSDADKQVWDDGKGGNVRKLRAFLATTPATNALRDFGAAAANKQLTSDVLATARKAGFVAVPSADVIVALGNLRTHQGIGGQIAPSNINDARLLLKYLQTNQEMNRIRDKVLDPILGKALADARDAFKPPDGSPRDTSRVAASSFTLQLDLSLGRAATSDEVRGLSYWQDYFRGREALGEPAVNGYLDRPELRLAADLTRYSGRNANPSPTGNWDRFDPKRNPNDVVRDWKTTGGRLDPKLDARTPVEKNRDNDRDPNDADSRKSPRAPNK